MVVIAEENTWELESIQGFRTKENGVELWCKWKDWGENDNSWEPPEHLVTAPSVLTEFTDYHRIELPDYIQRELKKFRVGAPRSSAANGSSTSSSSRTSKSSSSSSTSSTSSSEKLNGRKRPRSANSRRNASSAAKASAASSKKRRASGSDSKGHEKAKSSKKASEPEEEDEDVEPEYEIEKITDRRHVRGKVEYFIKWKGFAAKFNTWEPAANLESCRELITEYEQSTKNNRS